MTQLDRIESKVDAIAELLAVLLESTPQEDDERLDLDGNSAGSQRDGVQILG